MCRSPLPIRLRSFCFVQSIGPEDLVGEPEGLVDAHAAMAEGPALGGEEVAARRVVQVDRMLVREDELDEAERVALARRLLDEMLVAAADTPG